MSISRPAGTIFECLVFLIFFTQATFAQRSARPDPAAYAQQCMGAQTQQECREAIPICEYILSFEKIAPATPFYDRIFDQVWGKVGLCQHQLGRYAEAETSARHALRFSQRLYGAEHNQVATRLNNVAAALSAQGDFAAAEGRYREVLALKQKLLDPDHAEIGMTLNNLGTTLFRQGRYAQAEPLLRQGLEIQKKQLGIEHPDVANTINNLAAVLDRQGRVKSAKQLLEQTLDAQKAALGPEHPLVAINLSNQAIMLHRNGEFARAEALMQQALELQRKRFGSEHPQLATTLNNLGNILYSQGQYARAAELMLQSLELKKRLLGVEHPDIAKSLTNLSILAANTGQAPLAQQFAEAALELQRKLLGPEHPEIIVSINNLALTFLHQKQYARAESLWREGLVIGKKAFGTEHVELAAMLGHLANALFFQKKDDEAVAMMQQVLEMRKKLLGPDHPEVGDTLQNQAVLYLSQGRKAAADAKLLEAGRIVESLLRATVSETRMLNQLLLLRGTEELIYSRLRDPTASPATRKLALSTALLRKGRAQEAGVFANRLLHRNITNRAVQQRFEDWQAVRRQRDAHLYSGPGKQTAEEYRERLRALNLQDQTLEGQLSAELPELGKLHPPGFDEIIPAVAKRLPAQSVLIEVLWTEIFDPKSRELGAQFNTPSYVALLLFPDQRIVSIDLGNAADVDAKVRSLLESMQNPKSDPTMVSRALYQQIFAPLLPHIEGIRDVYLALDGMLNVVPFDALHDGKDYLLGRYRFHQLTSGRDLLRELSPRSPTAPLLLANPDFGKPDPGPVQGLPSGLSQKLLGLSPLSGTQKEANALEPLLGVRALTRSAATEEVIHRARGPRILHIATHGLFLRNEDLPGATDPDGLLRMERTPRVRSQDVSATAAEQLPGETGAMNRSALALAGVRQRNRADDTKQDGLLTAEEARSLDLEGTQLVVLSACATGQGELSAGQGVYGLRRAFLLAGAETLLTSLWNVDDEATGELMALYYRKLLDSQKPGDRLDAMIEAMTELRSQPNRAHPYYWAPFLVIGQDGPLRRVRAVQEVGASLKP